MERWYSAPCAQHLPYNGTLTREHLQNRVLFGVQWFPRTRRNTERRVHTVMNERGDRIGKLRSSDETQAQSECQCCLCLHNGCHGVGSTPQSIRGQTRTEDGESRDTRNNILIAELSIPEYYGTSSIGGTQGGVSKMMGKEKSWKNPILTWESEH